jgi:pyruvate-formate lyase-activating enzyme
MLNDHLSIRDMEPLAIADFPDNFLMYENILEKLSTLNFKRVFHMGQEASLDPVFSLIAKAIREIFDAKNVLLTNAHCMPQLEFVDRVEVGIKCINDSLHIDYTGRSNKHTLQNFKRIYASGVELMAESVFIPDYIELRETEEIVKFIASIDPKIPFVILPYFKAGNNSWRRPCSQEMDAAYKLAKYYLENVFFFYGNEELQYQVTSIYPCKPNNLYSSYQKELTQIQEQRQYNTAIIL